MEEGHIVMSTYSPLNLFGLRNAIQSFEGWGTERALWSFFSWDVHSIERWAEISHKWMPKKNWQGKIFRKLSLQYVKVARNFYIYGRLKLYLFQLPRQSYAIEHYNCYICTHTRAEKKVLQVKSLGSLAFLTPHTPILDCFSSETTSLILSSSPAPLSLNSVWISCLCSGMYI